MGGKILLQQDQLIAMFGSRVAGDDSQRGTLLPPHRRAYLTPAKNLIPTTSQLRRLGLYVGYVCM